MARAKKQDILDRLFENFSLRGFLLHQATLFVAATVLVITGVVFLWKNYQHTIADPTEFLLTEDKIELTAPPEWVDEDLRKLIASDDAQSILDPQLVSRTALKMRNVGFVESVNQIVKSKNGLKIDLQYRFPVGRIELSPITFGKSWNRDTVYLPIDRQGVLMPRRLPLEKLPRIRMLYPGNLLPGKSNELTTWSDIDDPRIRDAAAIAQFFVNDAQRIGIDQIMTYKRPLKDEDDAELPFQLWPYFNKGTKVIWGQAPGKELAAEAPVEQKLVALEGHIAKYGNLNEPNEPNGLTIDIRSGSVVIVRPDKVAKGNTNFIYTR